MWKLDVRKIDILVEYLRLSTALQMLSGELPPCLPSSPSDGGRGCGNGAGGGREDADVAAGQCCRHAKDAKFNFRLGSEISILLCDAPFME